MQTTRAIALQRLPFIILVFTVTTLTGLTTKKDASYSEMSDSTCSMTCGK